jgi:hypothetical protein
LKKLALAISILALLGGCKPSPEELARKQAAGQQAQKEACFNRICEGDVLPKYDAVTERPFKVGGQIFIGPKEYTSVNQIAFYWPSKTPAFKGGGYPEYGQPFADKAVEMFFTFREGSPSPLSRYDLLLKADAEGKVLSKTKLRKGLEAWRTKDRQTSAVIWYVATDLKDEKGDPPVLACNERDPKYDRCTMAFWWQPNIVVDMRFRAKHGADWPEIYQETVNVLSMIRKG